ncbi:MAG: sigma-70 family RNA polymerase sigma factor [Verrucomicrobiota bacterium]
MPETKQNAESDPSADRFLTRPSLIQKASSGKSSPAWDELHRFYEPFVSMVLSRMGFRGEDLADVSQQVFVKLWKGLESYESRETSRFRSWFSSIIRNTAVDWLRVHRKGPDQLSLDEPGAMETFNLGDPSGVEQQIEEEWRSYIVDTAMERIREVFTGNAFEVFARSLEGQTAEEISDALNVRIDSVYVLRSRVKGRLQREIQELRHDLEFADE